ncbi:hypothetical protein QAD02_022417 [Eretmocerus hayati]|uniref:Uncharacterized protein n=1 Tax=Eretmocerus hayati TaxID=131215 RepID=A0ACC2PUI7_9HYME|nr:hypothetical protein QAD02_022417 [Eretmocerus hayati]
MASGLANQAFPDVGRKISRHSLNISMRLRNVDGMDCEDPTSVEEEERPPDSNELENTKNRFRDFVQKNKRWIKYSIIAVLHLLFIVYFIFATLFWLRHSTDNDFHWCDGYGLLILVTALAYWLILYKKLIKDCFRDVFQFCTIPCIGFSRKLEKKRYFCCAIQTILCIALLSSFTVFLIVDTLSSRDRLMSLVGVGIIMLFGLIFSKYPTKVNWRPVIWGLILQFAFGLFTIRWSVGRAIFKCIANKVATFLNFAQSGASFVFSEKLVNDGVFAFSVLPVIFFFSFVIQILYYWGIMQSIIKNIGWILSAVMGTTVCESINSAANTFIGMTESPLLIKPYLNKLTSSEIHAIMCSGFATISGTVMAAYINFGADPAHLITASVMSAPAALCYSKLFYPETERSVTTLKNISIDKSKDTSVIDAATKGALAGIPLVLGIIANIVAFVSAVTFLNSVLLWLGILVGYENITLQLILAKVFMPLSWLMGVPWHECEDVGELIGLKTVVNEFIAYQRLGEMKLQDKLSARTEAIATYAICGFSNPGSVGIMIGGLSALAPEKREQITGLALRSFVAGSLVCFLTASTAVVPPPQRTENLQTPPISTENPLNTEISLMH